MPASLAAEASSKDEPEKKKKKLQKQPDTKVKKKSQVHAFTYFSLWAKNARSRFCLLFKYTF